MMLIDVRALSRRFGGLQALSEVSLSLARGEILGLIGPNGAGKTTLFSAVTGFLRPDTGSVWLDGQEITGLPPHAICRRGLARTFQLVQPFPELTVADNVMVGAFNRTRSAAAARRRALEVLELTGLGPLARRPAHALSIGLRKRLELARALATGPRALLLDEVMSGLTPTEVRETAEVIRGIRDGGVAIIVIEHVMAAVMELSDRIAVLHHGELIATGSPAEIAQDRRVIDAYLGEPLTDWNA
ncbi:MAG: ABC transporter ATP-binding protein [Candidatus Rokubacteria bacterium]|nr:ABC transporter ATP-binding protein [Candidatus Rokubacteria bacterium]MBI2525867.1 ABC transporter ATP-binding protein [Candidatus Rokubacteria bacterium]